MVAQYIYASEYSFGGMVAETDKTMLKNYTNKTSFGDINVLCYNFRTNKDTDTVDHANWSEIIKF